MAETDLGRYHALLCDCGRLAYARIYSGTGIKCHGLALLVGLEVLLFVLLVVGLPLILPVLRVQEELVFTGGFVVDLLQLELVRRDEVGDHLLEADDGVVSR